MKNITITHCKTGQPLFEGHFRNLRHAVETAIKEGQSLAFADLRHASLVNAEMDGAILDNALLENANLMGANISEASLRHTCFINAQMHSTVLCESHIEASSFKGALFGATDIAGAKINHCLFDTLSAFSLNFNTTETIGSNGFIAAQEQCCGFSRPPLVLHGLPYPVIRLDHHLLIGNHVFSAHKIDKQMPSALYNFIKTHKPLLEILWHARNGTAATKKVA